jgi:hypothetical protein
MRLLLVSGTTTGKLLGISVGGQHRGNHTGETGRSVEEACGCDDLRKTRVSMGRCWDD